MEVTPVVDGEEVSTSEIIKLGAKSGLFFNKHFFKRTTRNPYADFHGRVQAALDDPNIRFLNLQLFRGAAKTSLLRMFAAKRMAYNISRTILLLGSSETKANQTLRWLKSQVERNKVYTTTFKLAKGSKWDETQAEIWHHIDEDPIWLMSAGITTNVRGINFEDYRPDLVLLDDVISDESAATLEQRTKVNELVLGAIAEGLAPPIDNPNAKMVMMQTPLNDGDASMLAKTHPLWTTITIPCWTEATKDLVDTDQQISSWAARYPTKTLREAKKAAVATNTLSIFLREKEVRLVNPESARFKSGWLQFWDDKGAPPITRGMVVMAIDPVPPPTPGEVQKNVHTLDFEAIVVAMRSPEGNYYILDYATNRGHQPIWTATKVIEFFVRYKPLKLIFEDVGAQKAIGILLQQELQRAHINLMFHYKKSSIPKFNRIVSAFAGIGYNKRLFCSKTHTQFIADFSAYDRVQHDDLLDAAAAAVQDLISPVLEQSPGTSGITFTDDFRRKLKRKTRVP